MQPFLPCTDFHGYFFGTASLSIHISTEATKVGCAVGAALNFNHIAFGKKQKDMKIDFAKKQFLVVGIPCCSKLVGWHRHDGNLLDDLLAHGQGRL